jgi:hypothetical protein
MRVEQLEHYYISAYGLNQTKPCEIPWFLTYMYPIPREMLPPRLKFPMNLGNEMHWFEETKWDAIIEKKDTFTRTLLDNITFDEFWKMMFKYSSILCNSHPDFPLRYLENFSKIDATRFVDLRDHFKGDGVEAFKYLVPVKMEYDFKNHDRKTHVIIDHLGTIPKKFKNYKNKTDVELVIDYKPGRYDKNGKPKLVEKNGDYDKSYNNKFGRQLSFYSNELRYLKDELPKKGFVAGEYYKLGHFVLDKLDGRSYSAVEKAMTHLLNLESFTRRDRNDHWSDECNKCDFRLVCRPKKKYWNGYNGDSFFLVDFVKRVRCKGCSKVFITRKLKMNRETKIVEKRIEKYCCECKVKRENEKKIL